MAAINITLRNVDINSVMLGDKPVQLSNCVRNLRFVLDNQLNFNEQVNDVKRKVIANNVTRNAKFIDKDSKLKLVHGLVFFYN